jgi:hypothetical protein
LFDLPRPHVRPPLPCTDFRIPHALFRSDGLK